MRRNSSSLDHTQPDDTETFLNKAFSRLVIKAHEKGEVSDSIRDYYLAKFPEGLDELEECYSGLLHCVENKAFYQLISRIEKAEIIIEQEKDMAKKQYYIKKMKELAEQLERMGPA